MEQLYYFCFRNSLFKIKTLQNLELKCVYTGLCLVFVWPLRMEVKCPLQM